MSVPQNMWSRRRAAVQAEADAEEQAGAKAVVAQERAELDEKTDAEILTELNLKNPDDMLAGDDFSAFMNAAVPERLRRRALRKLWLTDPAFANVDGLVDYGDDFTDAATVIENIKTAYQVGRGFLSKPVEDEPDETLAELAEPEEVPAQTDSVRPPEKPDLQSIRQPELASIEPDHPIFDESPDQVMVKSRMRFEFAS